jgi:hypothetical protein
MSSYFLPKFLQYHFEIFALSTTPKNEKADLVSVEPLGLGHSPKKAV